MTFIPQPVANNTGVELENKDFTPNDRPAGDLYAHAPGRICTKCDRRIEAREPARRRGESGWAHDVCPPVGI